MTAELLLALGLPLLLVVGATLLLERNRGRLPSWLERLGRREALAWNVGIGLILGLSLLRWALHR
ncbi:MAG: hypothetical protein ACOVNL_13500 [Prochlorococcaceae cyanobacterium]|jgi:hypothetical protein